MPLMTRRAMIASAAAAAFVAGRSQASAATEREVVIWGPPAGPSITVAHAIATRRLRQAADKVTIKTWRNPDELRAGLTSGTMSVVVLPTQTAANLYNRGLGIRLVNVMTDGLLYIHTADTSVTELPHLKGRSVALPFRNDTPDLLFLRLLAAHGLDARRDLELHYTGTPIEAVQLLATGRVDAALLPEPAGAAVMLKAKMSGRDIVRAIDIQKAWAAATGLRPVLPQAGLGVTTEVWETQRPMVEALHQGLAEAVISVNANPAQAAADAAPVLGMPLPVLEQSIPPSNLVIHRASEARADLEALYAAIMETQPAMIGGRLPPAEFYL
ncbi:MAG: taurine ABC transporter substrate-binding protein [Rhodospirillaceae bacterium BRH_c57]|nr:MAG: taurine ABC transporter substrate-binding protein [Rhodospirillaceae bacterium BRH_c57]